MSSPPESPDTGPPPVGPPPRRSTNGQGIGGAFGTALGIGLCFAIVWNGLGLIYACIISGTIIGGLIAVRLASRLQGRARNIANAGIIIGMVAIALSTAVVAALRS